jgi:hypothetical protein
MTMAAARLGVFGRAEPPLANLASWRLGRAAEWLYSPRLTPARGKG